MRAAAFAVVFSTLLLGPLSGTAQAQVVLNDQFSTFANGNLVGQNGWTQFAAPTLNPIQVAGGQVVLPAVAPAITVEGQDAYKSFTGFVAPGAGTVSVFAGFNLTVSAAFTNPSFFFAMTDTPTGFTNERVAARDNSVNVAGTYTLGGRVTGQAGYPFVFGTSPAQALNYNQTYQVVVQADMVAGAQNDVLRLYVNPTSNILGAQTPYITSVYTSGSGTDPVSLGVVVLSQFASSTVGQAGVSLDQMVISGDYTTLYNALTPVPEPTSMALAGIGVMGFGLKAWRRRRASKAAK